MKEKMLEFVLKRLGGKIDDLREMPESYEVQEHVLNDIDLYFGELKSLLSDIFM